MINIRVTDMNVLDYFLINTSSKHAVKSSLNSLSFRHRGFHEIYNRARNALLSFQKSAENFVNFLCEHIQTGIFLPSKASFFPNKSALHLLPSILHIKACSQRWKFSLAESLACFQNKLSTRPIISHVMTSNIGQTQLKCKKNTYYNGTILKNKQIFSSKETAFEQILLD